MENEKYVMFYQIHLNNNILRILGEEFVKNNKNKGKIIYSNKKYHLLGLFKLKNIMNNTLKIQMQLNKGCCNKSFMFKNCSTLSLIKFNNNCYRKEEILFSFNCKSDEELNKDKEIYNYSENIIYNKEIDNYKRKTKISAMNEIFSNCSSLISLPDIFDWDTSNIIDMSKIFYNCRSLSFIPDISKWDTSSLIDMNNIFYKCVSLSSLPDISKLNTNKVVSIERAFYKCISLSILPNLSEWNNKITYIEKAIKDCMSLKSIFYPVQNKLNNIWIGSMYEKSCSIFKLTYEIKGESIIKLFDEGFAQDPKISCKMIIDNKLYLLSDKYQIFDYNQKFLKVKLLIMNKEKINLSYMFYECYALKNFSVLSHGENNLEDILKNKKKVVKNTTINKNDSNESSG